MKDLIIDCFAGGGGASVGIEMALGRPVDIAINHESLLSFFIDLPSFHSLSHKAVIYLRKV